MSGTYRRKLKENAHLTQLCQQQVMDGFFVYYEAVDITTGNSARHFYTLHYLNQFRS